ncbi:hypothetical protein [Streptomyces sp. NPDC088760]|uniref:hypothetical protein n=1 Tax=Streptomyces sp. NPDC088760 TaxID=3365890 RepID=UPI0038231069
MAKDPLHERLEDSGTRRIRGIAAQAILLAFQLAHANLRKLAASADAIALNCDRPRRRPTRRKTKPGRRSSQRCRRLDTRGSGR